LKSGNNINRSQEQIVEDILKEFNNYEANIEVTVKSNKNENKYEMKQVVKDKYSKQEILNPDNIKEPNTGNNSNNTSYVSQTTINNSTWKDIIANETDKNKNTLNKYFISNNISLTNEYTGMFEGKNLIVIMLESGSNLLYNSEFYPNLNKLYFDGWVFGNYFLRLVIMN